MKKIFVAYWVWYVLTLWFSSYKIIEAWALSLTGISSFLSYSYIGLGPLYYLIYGKKGKTSDPIYLNACLSAGVIRTIIWCFSYFGLSSPSTIFAINAFGMLVFIMIENKLRKIDKSYFEH